MFVSAPSQCTPGEALSSLECTLCAGERCSCGTRSGPITDREIEAVASAASWDEGPASAFAAALLTDGLERESGEGPRVDREPEEARAGLVAIAASMVERADVPPACLARLDRWLAQTLSGRCDRSAPAPPRISPWRSMFCAHVDRLRCARGLDAARALEHAGDPATASRVYEDLVFGPSPACAGRRDVGDLAVSAAEAAVDGTRAASLREALDASLPRPIPVITRAPPWNNAWRRLGRRPRDHPRTRVPVGN